MTPADQQRALIALAFLRNEILQGVESSEEFEPYGVAIQTIRAALQSVAGDGFVLAPREPTEEMMSAGDESIMDGLRRAQAGLPSKHPTSASHGVYRAMIAAAQPAGEGEKS